MDDISSSVQSATSTPEEAASNIQNATLYGTAPTADKDTNASMVDTRNKMAVPTQAEPAVKQFVDTSTEHASVAIGDPQDNDIPKWNYASRLMKYWGDTWNGTQPKGQRAASLAFEQMQNGGTLSAEHDMELWKMNQDISGLAKRKYDLVPERPPRDMFDIDAEEVGKQALKFGSDAVLGLANLPRSIYQGAKDALSDAEANPKQNMIGYSPFTTAAFGAAGFRTVIGGAYNQAKNRIGADGKLDPMDEESAKNFAWGNGAVYGGIMALSAGAAKVAGAALETVLNPETAPIAGMAMENAAVRNAVTTIGSHVAGLGSFGAVNEVSQIVNDSIQKHYDGTPASVYAGLKAAAADLESGNQTTRIFRAGALGGVMGLGTGLISAGVSNAFRPGISPAEPAAPGEMPAPPKEPPGGAGPSEPAAPSEPPVKPKTQMESMREFAAKDPETLNPNERQYQQDVIKQLQEHDANVAKGQQQQTDLNQRRIDIRKGHLAENLKETEALVAKYPEGTPPENFVSEDAARYKELVRGKAEAEADIVKLRTFLPTEEPSAPRHIGGEATVDEQNQIAKESLDFHQSLHDINDVLNLTKMSKVAPEQKGAMVKTMVKEAGIPHFVATLQDLFDWTSKNKIGKAKNWFNVGAIQSDTLTHNTPVQVDPVEVFQAAEHDPNILKIIAPPTGFHANGQAALDHLDKWQAKEQARQELTQSLGIKPKDIKPEPPAEGDNVGAIGQKPQAPVYNYAAAAKRTSELLNEKKATEQYIDEKTTMLQELQMHAKNGIVGINDKEQIEKLKQGLQNAPEQIKAIDKELEQLKGEVTEAMKKPEGKLIFGHWASPGMEDSTKVVASYLNGPGFSEAVRKHIPDAELSRIEQAELGSKEARISNIMSAAQHEMDQVHDIHTNEMKEARLIEAYDQLKNNPHLAITEKFRSSLNEKKKSIYQIDVNTLTKEQVEFADANKIRFKGVFAKKGGQDLTAVAQLLGLPDGDALLKIFATTPTREQMAKAIAGLNSLKDAAEIRRNDDLNHVKVIEELRNVIKNNLDQLEFLKHQDWSGFKTAIKRVALGLPPRIEAFEEEARARVSVMKIKDLNPKIYQVGRVKSERKAIDAVLEGDIGTAMAELERAAFNAAMEKEIRYQIGLANRRLEFAQTFTRREMYAILKEAKNGSVEAAKEILDLWKLSTPFKNTSTRGAYRKWMMKELKAGRGDFSIPKEMSDLRESPQEMTVEQLMVIHDRLNMIFQGAKRENRLQRLQDQADREAAAYDINRKEEEIAKRAKVHPGYNENRIRPPIGNRTRLQNLALNTNNIEAAMSGKQYIAREADKGEFGGFYYQTFEAEIAEAFYHEKQYNKEREAYLLDLKIRHNGGKKISKGNVRGYPIDRVEQKKLKLKQLKGTPLEDVYFTKADVMTAYANMGTASNKQRILDNNYLTEQQWKEIFDEHLTAADVEYVHGIFDWYKKRRPLMKALQDSQGREVQWIEGIPITHRGVTRMGGYIRLRYENDYTLKDAKNAEDYLENKDAAFYQKGDGAKWGRQFVDEATWQGHYKNRAQNVNKTVSLSFLGLHEGMAEIDHDLVYRIPMQNFFKLMSRPKIVKAMTAMLGESKLKTWIQTNLEIAGRPASRDDGWFTDTNKLIKKIFSKIGHTYAIQMLLGNSHVVLKQFESVFEKMNALGPMGTYYATKTLLQMCRFDYLPGLCQYAREMDPAIEKYITDTSDTAVDSVMSMLPRKGSSAIMDPIKNAGDMIAKGGFAPVMITDLFLKTWQVVTISNMYLAGHLPGHSMEDINKLSWEEKTKKLQMIVQQASTVLQIHNRSDLKAPVQKNLATALFTLFWNYPRNIFNNIFLDFRKIRWHLQDASDASGVTGFKRRMIGDIGGKGREFVGPGGGSGGSGGDGGGGPPSGGGIGDRDMRRAGKSVANAAGVAVWTSFCSVLAGMFLAWIYGRTVQSAKKGIHNMQDLAKWGEEAMEHMMLSRLEQLDDVTIGVKDIKRAIESSRKYQMAEVQNPLTQAMSEIATCFSSVADTMEMSRHMSRMESRACAMAVGYIPYVGIALPTHAMDQFMRWVDQPHYPAGFKLQTNQVAAMAGMTKEYASNPPPDVDPKYVQGIQQLHTQLAGDASQVPKGMADTIKLAESKGDWMAPNGIYGFKSDEWNQIKRAAPELDLTEKGRIAKNTEQQEKAISWELEHNARELAEKNLPVDKDTMFGAHKVGLANYEKLYNAKGDESLKKDFPGLAKDPEFTHLNTVTDLMGYLAKKLDGAAKGKLTQNTPNTEDKL